MTGRIPGIPLHWSTSRHREIWKYKKWYGFFRDCWISSFFFREQDAAQSFKAYFHALVFRFTKHCFWICLKCLFCLFCTLIYIRSFTIKFFMEGKNDPFFVLTYLFTDQLLYDRCIYPWTSGLNLSLFWQNQNEHYNNCPKIWIYDPWESGCSNSKRNNESYTSSCQDCSLCPEPAEKRRFPGSAWTFPGCQAVPVSDQEIGILLFR